MSLKFSILIVVGSFFYTQATNFTNRPLSTNPSILVIGSGPSAIAAASKLWRNNFQNLRIYEAENRIGGRVNSIKFGDAYVDMGGEWCHGEVGNIVYDMVKQYNILRHTNLTVQMFYSNGSLLEQDIYNNLVDFAEYIDPTLRNSDVEEQCGNFSSVGECFNVEFNSTFTRIYQNSSEKRAITVDAEDWLESYILGYDSPFSLYDLSRTSAYRRCEGDLALNWNGRGYKTILELMLQQFPDSSQELGLVNNILLNKEVSQISWNNNTGQNTVLCTDNSISSVDHVIFTPSLGVLKANHERLFEPNLPENKIRAIGNIGFGAIMKIILHFPNTWWNPHQPYAFLWTSEDKERILTEFGRGPQRNGRSWLTTNIAFLPADNNPRVLIGFFAGEFIPEMEREDNEVLSAGCMYMFRKFLSRTYNNITDPDDIVKSTWYNNPHFRGTYSFELANNTERGLPDILAEPLTLENGHPRVLFAGEATHPYYFSTVHGAIESGFREADRLINYYRPQWRRV